MFNLKNALISTSIDDFSQLNNLKKTPKNNDFGTSFEMATKDMATHRGLLGGGSDTPKTSKNYI